MLTHRTFTDMVLVARGHIVTADCITEGDVELKCHRCVLASVSPVFARMLASEFKEGQEAKIMMTDFDETVVGIFLQYMYCGRSLHDEFMDLDVAQTKSLM